MTTDSEFTREDIKYMKAALRQAEKALAIGSVLVTAGRALVDLFDEDDED